MDNLMKYILLDLFEKKRLDTEYICSVSHELNFEDWCKSIIEFFNDNYEILVKDEKFLISFSSFVNRLTISLDKEKDKFELRNMINSIIKTLKTFNKPYNKKEKKKDSYYHFTDKLKNDLEQSINLIDLAIQDNSSKYETFKIMKFIIFELKNPDYLFRILQVSPDYVNAKNAEGESLFTYICNNYLDNVYRMPDDEKRYFKRVIILILESDNLSLKNSELSNLYERADRLNSIKESKDLIFFVKALVKHFPTLNGRDKINAVSYTSKVNPDIYVKRDEKDPLDLTDLFTLTIDGNRNTSLDNFLFDDAFSLIPENGNFHLLVHIPDVDLVVERDSELDEFMRGLGSSVYAKDYKKALLDYKIAKEVSLEQGKVRPVITFDILVNNKGEVLNIDFYKSLINVNYNLTKDKADAFMKYTDSDIRFKSLKTMYNLARASMKNRKETIGKRSPAKVIMEEFNTLPNLATAKYFEDEKLPFIYKNYAGKRKAGSAQHVNKVSEYIKENTLSGESVVTLNSIFDIYNRVFYDIINYGNASYHGTASGSVGNPMREYISLETDRLISDLVIDKKNNIDYWMDRAERDAIEYTETSAKLEELYKKR